MNAIRTYQMVTKCMDKLNSAIKVKLYTSEKGTKFYYGSATCSFTQTCRLLGGWHSRANGELAKCFRLAFSPSCTLSSASSGWQKGMLITKTHTTFYRPQRQSTGAVKSKGNKTRYSELPILKTGGHGGTVG